MNNIRRVLQMNALSWASYVSAEMHITLTLQMLCKNVRSILLPGKQPFHSQYYSELNAPYRMVLRQ